MGIGTTPSLTLRRKEFAYFVAMCVPMFLNGWTDASAGPLLPRLQAHYEIGYIVVSMIFVANCIGAITAALTNMWLTTRFGLGITVALAAAAHCLSYAIQATKPPFPLMAISFAINGFGEGLFEAQTNGLVALLPTNPNAKLSFMHGLYGVGAFASPLIATQFSNMPTNWHRYYLVSLGLGLAALGILLWVTRLKHQDALLHEIGVHPEEDTNRAPLIRQVMELKIVHIMAAFILFYVGMEVTVGGWTVTFMQRTRGAGSGAGYVSSGFFGGVAVGRMGLIWVNRKVGLQRVIYIYSLAAIALELTVWFVPSLYENAVAVAFVGVVIGPFYPIAMRVTSVLVPRRALAGAIGWISCVGRIGSAAFPFAFALMASKATLLSCLLGIWFLVPSIQQRTD
ncbi:MFS general substrate transporter [Clavulina sp. PMI_390]|nr:MFS general substrate transporter [Clavulina sp. PMI_390]